MTSPFQSCTHCGSGPTKTRRAGFGLLQLVIALSIIVVLAMAEVWVIERAPDFDVTVDVAAPAAAAVVTDVYLMPIRELERDSPPVAVLH